MTDRAVPGNRLALVIVILVAFPAFVAGGGAFALAQDDHAHHHEPDVAAPVASPAATTGTGIVYLTVTNTGSAPDRLIAAETGAAQEVSFHASGGGGDVMQMTEQPGGFTIEPGETLLLEPGGAHLMLKNLNHDLRPATTFKVTLSFEVAGDIELEVTVGGDAPEGDPSQLGELLIDPGWSLPAPRLGDGPGGTPEATPHGSN